MALTDEELAKELFRAGIVTVDVIQNAVKRRTPGKGLALVLIESGVVGEADIRQVDPTFSVATAPADRKGADAVDLTQTRIEYDAASLLSRDAAVAFRAIPISRNGNRLKVAMADTSDLPALDQIAHLTHCRIEAVPANAQDIMQTISQVYASSTMRAASDLATSSAAPSSDEPIEDIAELVDSAPSIRIANMILQEAVKLGASDVHIEPREGALCLRYRVDGVLRPPTSIEKAWEQSIISRFKVLSEMDLAENRMPQDGRFRQTVADKVIDFRVSTLPTFHGEKVVLRLLDKSSLVGLDKLGFQPEMKRIFEELTMRPQGMILVTGPTGSGKSTTLYAALNRCKSETKNVVTVEDPIEYQLDGINQTHVIPHIGLNFATQLRAILRQDPDVILVGEIRDKETAEMAFRAALTGHLVLSTLHTNDAPSTVTRLLDMGMEGHLVASSILAVLAQRLVRLICPKCKEPTTPTDFDLSRLGLSPQETRKTQFFHGKGCDNCSYTGYKGRLGLYELLVMSEPVRQKIAESASPSDIRLAALSQGMVALRQDGLAKVRQGLTTVDELGRVLFASIEDEVLLAAPESVEAVTETPAEPIPGGKSNAGLAALGQ